MAQTAQSGPTPHFVTGRALLYEYPGTHDFFPLHFILVHVLDRADSCACARCMHGALTRKLSVHLAGQNRCQVHRCRLTLRGPR
jgi:hypothetical protein